MSMLDFEKAQYTEPAVVDGFTGVPEKTPQSSGAFPLALVYGVGAAVVGALGYALIGLTGIMVSFVTIGIGWLVGRAIMTATKGVGSQQYQIAAVVLTYLSASTGRLIDSIVVTVRHGYSLAQISPITLVKFGLFGPFLRLSSDPVRGTLGLLFLFYGLRTAWQMAAGTPGFGTPGGPRMTIMGIRR